MKYLKCTAGNTAIIFSLAVIPMLLAAGAAVDMVRANRVQAVLQGAVDSAALAGAVQTDKSEIKKLVEDYLAINGAQDALENVEGIHVEEDKKTGTFRVSINGKIKTTFIGMVGVSTMDLSAASEVKRGSQALEVALVLDNTDSMNAEGRLFDLKTSAKLMIKEIFDNKSSDTYVKVGIVPFSNYVNVGMPARSETWMNVSADTSSTSNQCWNEYPNATKSNCRMVPYSYSQDGVPVSGESEQCDWNYGTPVQHCAMITTKSEWHGCTGSRNSPLDTQIGSPSVPYPGIMDAWCPAPITDLTDDEAKLRQQIDAMTATSNTYIPAGLLWGWNMLNSAAPLTSAKTAAEMSDLQGRKVIVLMTDGYNTLVPVYPRHETQDPAPQADTILLDICKNVKTDDIDIYTVAFKVKSSDMLKNLQKCASDPSKAYDAANSVELAGVFKEIAAKLSAVRLTK